MAGSITITQIIPTILGDVRGPRKIEIAWLSDASGDVSGNSTDGTGSVTSEPSSWGHIGAIIGTLKRVAFVPDGGGTQPTDLYDVLLNDENGVDILGGQGANLSNASASDVVPGVPLKDGTTTSVVPPLLRDVLTPVISNAGNAKGGTIVLYLE